MSVHRLHAPDILYPPRIQGLVRLGHVVGTSHSHVPVAGWIPRVTHSPSGQNIAGRPATRKVLPPRLVSSVWETSAVALAAGARIRTFHDVAAAKVTRLRGDLHALRLVDPTA